jgi:hypothetical protein
LAFKAINLYYIIVTVTIALYLITCIVEIINSALAITNVGQTPKPINYILSFCNVFLKIIMKNYVRCEGCTNEIFRLPEWPVQHSFADHVFYMYFKGSMYS